MTDSPRNDDDGDGIDGPTTTGVGGDGSGASTAVVSRSGREERRSVSSNVFSTFVVAQFLRRRSPSRTVQEDQKKNETKG